MQPFTNLIEKRGFVVKNSGDLAGIEVQSKVPDITNFINQAASEENPADLPQKYENTKKWIESSTPELRRELYRILYAFFFHSAIILFKSRNEEIFRKFLQDHFQDHHKYHQQDRPKFNNMLKRGPGQLVMMEGTKFSLKITKTSWNALVSFLSQEGYATFLRILDEKLDVEFVPFEKVQYAPDIISEFILPSVDRQGEKVEPQLTLARTAIDYANEYIKKLQEKKDDQKNSTNFQQLHILDDDESKRDDVLLDHPKIHLEQILTTANDIIQMARLSKSDLPSTAYFTFPDHDTDYDINNDGTLISVCTKKGITKLISTDVKVDLDDLPLFRQITAPNDRMQMGFEFLNQNQIPRPPSPFKVDGQLNSYYTRFLIGPRAFFTRFSPNSQFLMNGGSGYVRIWTCEHNGAFSHIQTPSLINWCGDWSPFNHQFAIGSQDYSASLWSVERATMIRLFVTHQKQVVDVKFHPNSYLLATCSADCSVHLWDIKSAKSTRTFADRTEPPVCMQFTRNGQILITGDEAGALTAWDLRADSKLGRCEAHNGAVRDIALSQEGTVIATVGSDREILLWDTDTFKTSAIAQAKPLKMLQTKASDTRRAKFSSRNLLLALGSKINPE